MARELLRPASRLRRSIHRWASRVYSPYLYDMTAGRRITRTDGALQLGTHAAIYAIAPFDGVWTSHLGALRYLASAGASPVVVSNLPLSDSDRVRIAEKAALVIERPNRGYDFGAYREGVLHLKEQLPKLERMSFFNDSVWFPLEGSIDWIAEVSARADFVTGAASNYGGSREVPSNLNLLPWTYGPAGRDYHFPSYAVSFCAHAVRDPAFRRFWTHYPLADDKELTVARGEIGLSQWAISQGWSAKSTYSVEHMDQLLAPLPTPRLREIAENLIVLGNARFLALKHRVLQEDTDRAGLMAFLLAATRCLGVSYAFADFNALEMRFPFLKKSPVWLQEEASDITLRLIERLDSSEAIRDEAVFLRRRRLGYA